MQSRRLQMFLRGFVIFLVLLVGSQFAYATEVRSQVAEIHAFAREFCGEFWQGGASRKRDLSGKAELKLADFIKKFAGIGLAGEASSKVSDYIGVPQRDLASELKSIRDCKLRLWKDFKNSLLRSGGQPQLKFVSVPPKGASLTYSSSSHEVVELSGEIVTYGDEFEVVADTLLANDATIRVVGNGNRPPIAQRGGNGADGANGRNGSGGEGGHGEDGGAGANGGDARDAQPILIQVRVLSGSLTIDSSGFAGERGGNGGAGGNGGRGGKGRDGSSGLIDCRRGPRSGGVGGNAGRGGAAGDGGDGGNAGDVTITAREIQRGSTVVVKSKGGRGESPGNPGRAGSPGTGGPRGSAPGWCRPGGATRGPDGAQKPQGSPGQPGTDGRDGTITATIGTTKTQQTGTFILEN